MATDAWFKGGKGGIWSEKLTQNCELGEVLSGNHYRRPSSVLYPLSRFSRELGSAHLACRASREGTPWLLFPSPLKKRIAVKNLRVHIYRNVRILSRSYGTSCIALSVIFLTSFWRRRRQQVVRHGDPDREGQHRRPVRPSRLPQGARPAPVT